MSPSPTRRGATSGWRWSSPPDYAPPPREAILSLGPCAGAVRVREHFEFSSIRVARAQGRGRACTGPCRGHGLERARCVDPRPRTVDSARTSFRWSCRRTEPRSIRPGAQSRVVTGAWCWCPASPYFASWIGLVPRQNSTGGKQKLGPISKQGDRYFDDSRCRRALCPAPRKAEPAETSLAHATLGAAAVQGRGGRAGQQNGAHGMGVAGQGRRLSGVCARSNGLRGLATGDEIASVRSRTAGVMTTLMRNGRDRRSETP